MANRRRLGGRARPRRMTDWEANSPQSTIKIVTLAGVVTAQILFPRSVLDGAGPRSTLTRILLELGLQVGGVVADTVVHMALLVVSLDSTGAIQAYDPTNIADLNKGGILWQRQVFLPFSPIDVYRETIAVKGQRKLREDQVIAFFIEPNGGQIQHHIGGRALLKLT